MITICKRCGIEFDAMDDRKKLCQDCVEVKKLENAYKQWDKKWKEAKKKENHNMNPIFTGLSMSPLQVATVPILLFRWPHFKTVPRGF